jgi:hypothetical protein
VIAITQRPAALHKHGLSQADTLIALKLVAPQDRKAVEEWIKGRRTLPPPRGPRQPGQAGAGSRLDLGAGTGSAQADAVSADRDLRLRPDTGRNGNPADDHPGEH